MENPLDLPVPQDRIQRAHDYARDMAWLLTNDLCYETLITGTAATDTHKILTVFPGQWIAEDVNTRFRAKWENPLRPSVGILEAFDLITEIPDMQSHYRLTRTAYSLLLKPPQAPSVFISYRRKHSTTFALLVEARLRLAGNQSVFVDKMLEIGGDWREELEQRVAECQYLIVLIGETTFESEWVRREVEVAAANGAIIIPIWHPGVKRNEHTPQVINDRQEIRVERENADGYETAISKLLNRMGYATY
jgi:hypothetical protein